MFGNPVGMVCVLKDGNRDLVGRVTSASMRQATGCVPELDLTMRVEDVSLAPPSICRPVYMSSEFHNAFRYDTKFKAKRVIFNPPATVVLWADGTKTVVKCDPEDEFDVMTGVALCYMKKALGNKSGALNKALRQANGETK